MYKENVECQQLLLLTLPAHLASPHFHQRSKLFHHIVNKNNNININQQLQISSLSSKLGNKVAIRAVHTQAPSSVDMVKAIRVHEFGGPEVSFYLPLYIYIYIYIYILLFIISFLVV